jgi:hypothetical protein
VTDRPGPGPTVHEEVASYAIGALDDAEATRFEEHLVTCEACARRLESFLPVVGLLPEVPLSTVDLSPRAVELDSSTGDLPPRPIELDSEEVRARHRRRVGLRTPPASVHGLASATRRHLRRPAVAAAAAAVAAVAVTAGLFGELAYDQIVTTQTAAGVPERSAPWDGLGGPDLEHGRHLSVRDAGTGVHADVVLDSAPWGTRVSFALSELAGPQTCRLVAVRRDGTTEVLSSWVVPPEGYGRTGQPRPLVLQAATALGRADITALRVEAVGGRGAPRSLVTVPA